MHGVAHRAQVLGKVVRQAHPCTVGRHIDDLRDQAAVLALGIDALDRDPVAGHGGGKLARHTRERCRVLEDGKFTALWRGQIAAGQRTFARASLPDRHGPVEADAIDHLGLEHRGHIEQIAHRLLDKGQARQAQAVDVHGLQIAQHIGQGRDQVGHADLAEVGQLLQVLGLYIELALKRLGRDRHRRCNGRVGRQVDARDRGVDRQHHVEVVLVGRRVNLECALDETDVAGQLGIEAAARPLLACHAADGRIVGPAYAQAQWSEVGVQDHILRRQAAVKAELAQVELGGKSIGPIQREVEVQRRLEVRIDLHHAIHAHPDLAQGPFEIEVQACHGRAHFAGKAQVQARLVKVKAQAAGAARAHLPVVPQIGLQTAQGGHRLGPKSRHVLTQVVQHMLTQTELVGNLQQVFERAANQGQVFVGQQISVGPVHLLGQRRQGVGQQAFNRGIDVADREIGDVGCACKLHLHLLPAYGDGLVQRLARAIDRQVHLAHEGSAAQARNRQAQAGLQIERIALARQDQSHLPVDHTSPLPGHIDRRVQAAGGDLHGPARIDLQAQVGRTAEQGWIGLRRARCAQLDGEGALGLHLCAGRFQVGHAATLQQHRGQAIIATIAIDIALAEVNHPALERASARPHVEAQAHATATERQARHALQAGRSGARLQADKAGLAARVLHQGQSQAGVLQTQAHKILRACTLTHLHIDVARRDQGGAQAAPVAVVQRSAAQPHGGQAKAAAHAQHIADAQAGIETQAQEFSGCIAEVQRFAALRTGAHRQRPLHQVLTAAAVGQVHHCAVGNGTAVA